MNPSIDEIASNKTSGAAEILRLAAEVFSQLKQHQPGIAERNVQYAQQAIFETAVALVTAQPDMSPLLRLASVAISAAGSSQSAPEALKSAEEQALRFIATAQSAARRAAVHAANAIPPGSTVMTHSRSSTVLAALVGAKNNGRDFSVVATESHPGMEGRTLAEALARENIRVRLIADVDSSLAMDDVDLVMVGADTITDDLVVNKIGTRMLAYWAEQRGLPFYSICDTSKFISADYWCRPFGDEEGVNSTWPSATTDGLLANGLFEPTPIARFTGIITEDGVLSSNEASRRAEQTLIDKQLSDALLLMRIR